MSDSFYVYIVASYKNRVLYIGSTSNLQKRIWEHKEGLIEGFTKKYNVNRLVYYEVHEEAETAFKRERNMKEWKRDWKIELIEKDNSKWRDLYDDLF